MSAKDEQLAALKEKSVRKAVDRPALMDQGQSTDHQSWTKGSWLIDIVKKSGVKLHEYKDLIVPEDYFSEAQAQLILRKLKLKLPNLFSYLLPLYT